MLSYILFYVQQYFTHAFKFKKYKIIITSFTHKIYNNKINVLVDFSKKFKNSRKFQIKCQHKWHKQNNLTIYLNSRKAK